MPCEFSFSFARLRRMVIKMNKRTAVKIMLDAVMTVLYLMLMFADWAGEYFHEFAGLLIGALFILHIALNLRMFSGLFRRSSEDGRAGDLILFTSDLLLPVGMAIVIVTGALMAESLFTADTSLDRAALYDIHNITSYVNLGLLGVHLLLHARYLAAVIVKLTKKVNLPVVRSAARRFAAGGAAAVIIYGSVYAAVSGDDTTADPNDGVTYLEAPVSSEETGGEEKETAAGTESAVEDAAVADEEDGTAETEEEDDKKSASENGASDKETTSSEDNSAPTLNSFLALLSCGGCGKRCTLLNPQCGRGRTKAAVATEEYYETYGE